jgi:hypothetical protein
MNLTGRGVPPKHAKPERIKCSTYWAAQYGTDAEFQAFVRKLPSAISGKLPCVFAHYRTAANSGTGIKPEFSGIPMTDAENLTQHRVGQYNFIPRKQWEFLVEKYLRMWIQSVFKPQDN